MSTVFFATKKSVNRFVPVPLLNETGVKHQDGGHTFIMSIRFFVHMFVLES